jgi:hypothetical protein
MRRKRGWTRLRTSFVALALAAAATGHAQASSMSTDPLTTSSSATLLTYDTVGSWIDTTGVTSTGSPTMSGVTYSPTTGSSFLTPSSLSLGGFQANALGSGQTITYANTPFHIKLTADAVNGQAGFQPNGTPIDISGVLNGTLSGANQSTVTATFNKPLDSTGAATNPAAYTFLTGLYNNTLQIPDNPLTIVPSTANNGMTTAQAVLADSSITSPVPEPSTIVLFAATVAGLGFRHRIRKARATD